MVLVTRVIVVVIVLRFGGDGFGRGGKRLFFGRLCGAQNCLSVKKNLAEVW
jgi:hypothetical protein